MVKRGATLAAAYPDDLGSNLGDELLQFKDFVRDEKSHLPEDLIKLFVHKKTKGMQNSFPNVFVALRLFLTLHVTNCEGEKSFSVLKRVKNELRTKMGQQRLSALSLLAIESELAKETDFEELINDFASQKSRKKSFF